MDDHIDARTHAGQRFVDGVIHYFIYQVMQGFQIRATYIHTGAAADSLEAFQHLNTTGIVIKRIYHEIPPKWYCGL
jgi:hypothetical protein